LTSDCFAAKRPYASPKDGSQNFVSFGQGDFKRFKGNRRMARK
jgi:hypothetical protein